MRYYKRFPDRALAGMADLNIGQRGVYNSIIDVLYSRDGLLPCATPADDYKIARAISVDVRTWRTVKQQLIALGKLWITGGHLMANGVLEGLNDAETTSETAKKRARIRWDLYRSSNKNKAEPMPARICNDSKKESKSSSRVDNGDKPSEAIPVTSSLEAAIRAKGWA